jgi:hypothetical protein
VEVIIIKHLLRQPIKKSAGIVVDGPMRRAGKK